jgi:hypothetical protein
MYSPADTIRTITSPRNASSETSRWDAAFGSRSDFGGATGSGMIWGSSFDTGSTPYGDGTSVAKTVRGAADSGGLAIDMSILHG